jgi:hypothetical protein
MIPRADIPDAIWEEIGPLALCEDAAEIVLVAHKLGGMPAVEFVLDKAKMSKETLREAADRLKAVGLTEMSGLLRQHARKAKSRGPSFHQRMRLKQRMYHQRLAQKL